MTPQAAAAYYAQKYGSAEAALIALAGSWVDAEDREVRTILEGLRHQERIANLTHVMAVAA